jgi:hypothetical protein
VIEWLSKRLNCRHHCLLWDDFSAHRDEEVKQHAPHAERHSDLCPDWHNRRAPASGPAHFWKFTKLVKGPIRGSLGSGHELTPIGAIEIILKVWNNLCQDEVLYAWSKFTEEENPEISIQP